MFAVALLVLTAGLLAYAQAPLTTNMPANGVLGQADLVSRVTGKTASSMNNAFGVAVDPATGKLFVADRNNNRVLRFSSSAKLVNGGAAEAAFGQPSLDSNGVNTGGISAATMNTPDQGVRRCGGTPVGERLRQQARAPVRQRLDESDGCCSERRSGAAGLRDEQCRDDGVEDEPHDGAVRGWRRTALGGGT